MKSEDNTPAEMQVSQEAEQKMQEGSPKKLSAKQLLKKIRSERELFVLFEILQRRE